MKSASENDGAGYAGNFLFLGEHPALDFANTLLLANGAPVELFNSCEDILHWLELSGLVSPVEKKILTEGLRSPARQHSLLGEIQAFRGQWKTNVDRLIAGKMLAPDFLDLLNHHLNVDLSWPVLEQKSGTRTFHVHQEHAPLEPAKKIPALLANAIAQFLASAKLQYLRRCAGVDCVIYFYDTTKSHRRQWCSMAICGNRHKVAKFRAKRS